MKGRGYVKNCYIQPKVINNKFTDNGCMFENTLEGDCIAYLDGYAIIPLEEYEALKEKV